jgi:hypothetical protein
MAEIRQLQGGQADFRQVFQSATQHFRAKVA